MSEENKAIVRRYVDQVINQDNMAVIDESFDTTYVNHTSAGDMYGPEGMKAFVTRVRTNLPDLQARVEDIITAGDKVVMRLTLYGTYTGEVMGIASHGKQVTIPEIQIYRLTNGKIVERWYIADRLGLWQQLGVIPSAGPVRG